MKPTLAIALAFAVVSAGGGVRADMSGRLALADDIERRLDGFFIFTTDGSGTYVVYQRVETGRGLSSRDEVVCMARDCYLAVARVQEGALSKHRSLEKVRHRFRAAREAYGTLQSASAGDYVDRADAWRNASARLEACLGADNAC